MPTAIRIHLTNEEIERGKSVGWKRRNYDESNRHKVKNKYDVENEPIGVQERIELQAGVSEVAVAKWLGVPYDDHFLDFGAKDVAEYQVKSTRLRWHRLLIKPDDADNEMYIKVTVDWGELAKSGDVWIEGWAYGKEAKEYPPEKLREDRPAAHFVPNAKLHDMTTLPGLSKYRPETAPHLFEVAE